MKLGIIGAGHIAHKICETLINIPEIELYGIASRELYRAEIFKEKYGFEKAYSSYYDLAKDKEVELIYVATPHSLHYENVKMCLQNNKHVICEKAFALDSKQANEMIELAEKKKLFLTEAFWTRFMPLRFAIKKEIEAGTIGDIVSITANFDVRVVDKERIIRKELGGGALLDLGVYPINFALMFAQGEIESISTTATFTSTDVDSTVHIKFTFFDGTIAYLKSSILDTSESKGIIYGTKGYIICDSVCNLSKAKIYDQDGIYIKTLDFQEQISGYEFEFIKSLEAIQQSKLECEEMPHIETLRIMQIIDYIKEKWAR